MKIGYSRINAYNKATTVSSQKGRSEKAEKTGVIKTDKVTISAEGTEYKGLTKIQNEMTDIRREVQYTGRRISRKNP